MNTTTKIFSSLALTTMLFSATAGSASAMANDGGQGQAPKQTSVSKSTNTYTVQRGDTLSSIASKYGTSYQQLMSINGLSSTTIYAGQSLKVSGSVKVTKTAAPTTQASTTPQYKRSTSTSSTTTTTSSSASYSNVAQAALAQVGVPYKWGGKTPAGFDCSGLVYYAMQKAGKSVGYATSTGYYSMGTSVSTPQVGDLVFFQNTYKSGISHVGIYIGNGQMVSAASGGVQIDAVQGAYWKNHFVGYKRF